MTRTALLTDVTKQQGIALIHIGNKVNVSS